MRPQHFRNRSPPQNAPAHATAHSRQQTGSQIVSFVNAYHLLQLGDIRRDPAILQAGVEINANVAPVRASRALPGLLFAANFNKSVSLTLAMRVAVQSAFFF
jgi:hypothetical protein